MATKSRVRRGGGEEVIRERQLGEETFQAAVSTVLVSTATLFLLPCICRAVPHNVLVGRSYVLSVLVLWSS